MVIMTYTTVADL